MIDWLNQLSALQQAGIPAVLVTVAQVAGSTPREAGAKMIVTAADLYGTIGGGALEWQALAAARRLLADGATVPQWLDLPLGPALGQCCGGRVGLLLEPILPPDPDIVLFGAGHVGRALATVLAQMPGRLTWVEERPGQFPADPPPGVRLRQADPAEAELASVSARAWVLIMTHDHGLDYRLALTALRDGRGRRVGVIGSASKAARFRRRLVADGIGPAALERFLCPIGRTDLPGKHPGEIAVSVAAWLMNEYLGPQATGTVQPAETACAAGGCAGCPAKGDENADHSAGADHNRGGNGTAGDSAG